jgi:hypothetical protein
VAAPLKISWRHGLSHSPRRTGARP